MIEHVISEAQAFQHEQRSHTQELEIATSQTKGIGNEERHFSVDRSEGAVVSNDVCWEEEAAEAICDDAIQRYQFADLLQRNKEFRAARDA